MSYDVCGITLMPAECEAWASRATELKPGPGGAGMSAVFAHGRLAELFNGTHQARFVGLWPQQQIPGHADPPIQGIRYHIPIATNPGAWCFHAGVWQQLHLGHVYRMDPALVHGAVNWGDTVRIHLMVDVG